MRISRIIALFGGCFISFGLVFVAVGVGIGLHERSFRARAAETDAIVVKNERSVSGESPFENTKVSVSYRPVIAFRTAAGTNVEVTSHVGHASPSYREGEEVKVLYDPEDPQSITLGGHDGGFAESWMLPIIFAGMGSVLSAFGLGIVVVSRRVRRAEGGASVAQLLASTVTGRAA